MKNNCPILNLKRYYIHLCLRTTWPLFLFQQHSNRYHWQIVTTTQITVDWIFMSVNMFWPQNIFIKYDYRKMWYVNVSSMCPCAHRGIIRILCMMWCHVLASPWNRLNMNVNFHSNFNVERNISYIPHTVRKIFVSRTNLFLAISNLSM